MHYACEISEIGRDAVDPRKTAIAWTQNGKPQRLDDIDLLIAADGRYSRVRRAMSGEPAIRQTGVAIFARAGAGYVERPDRRLRAMVQRTQSLARVSRAARPYLYRLRISDRAGSADPAELKTPDALRAAYTPLSARAERAGAHG